MAAIQEFTQVSTQLRAIASNMMTFRDDWFSLSDDYQGEVTVLNARLQVYQDLVNEHVEVDQTVIEIMKNAVRSLQTAESRLDGLSRFASSDHYCSPLRGWCVKLILVLFPERVERMVTKVNADLEKINKVLKEKSELSTQLREEDRRRPVPRLLLNNNSLYVPIEKSQQAVMAAIEDPHSKQFILLHGGVGKGKSTLARYLVSNYGPEINKSNTQGRDNRNLFEHIIWVSCAGSSEDDIAAKQFAILMELSPNILGDSLPSDISGPKRIAKALRDFLSVKKVLMILDDVTDAAFLYAMWDSVSTARHVKYLVTSQKSNICDSFVGDSSIIPMENATDNEAMHILASLVGLKAIPEKLEVVAKNILRETENNPLALACVAGHFAYSTDKTNKRAWLDAYTHLYELLQNIEGKIVLHSTPRSLWAAMKLCLDSLETADARKILFLMYACKGEAVPEAVLRILHARIKASSCTFFQSSNELVMRELLKSTVQLKDEDHDLDEGSKAWSIKSLVKHYIMVSMRDEVSSWIGKLIVGEKLPTKSTVDYEDDHDSKKIDREKAAVVIILCGLYFDRTHTDIHELVTKAIAENSIDCTNDSFNDLSRQAVEPIVNLLDKPADKNWQESDVSCARQVFLTYICKRQLDDNNFSQLLMLDACFEAQLATLAALRQICFSEERPLFKDNKLNFLQAILHLTNSHQHLLASVHEAAFQTLIAVCSRATQEHSEHLIIDSPGVLDVLVNSLAVANEQQDGADGPVQLLSAHDRPSAQKHAAHILAHLMVNDDSVKRQIANQEGLVAGLVQCLAANDHPDVQKMGAWALAILVSCVDSSIQCSIANQDGALVGLVQLLSAHDRPSAQGQAANVLGNLMVDNDSVKRQIANQEGAIAGLVQCLAANDHPDVQLQGARALANLVTSGDSSIQCSIANQEGAVAGLVECLAADEHPAMQVQGARALENLASCEDGSIKYSVANQSLVGLVQLLSADDRPSAQKHAAHILGHLMVNDDSVKRQIANQEGAVAGLVQCLAANDHPDVQGKGAWALAILVTCGDSSIRCSIANQDGALVGLVQLLSAHDRPSAQEHAGNVLCNLIVDNDSVKRQIAHQEGAVAGLVQCLAANDHPDVQNTGAWALANIVTCGDSSIQCSIANQDGALVGLVQLLSAHDRPSAQKHAANALGNLMVDNDSVKRQIADQEGVVAGLVQCLAANDHPDVRKMGAWALANLITCGDSSILCSIANQEGAVAGLVECLAAAEHPDMQEQGARALANLASCEDGSIKYSVANQDGALVGLVQLLSAHDRPSEQKHAARALDNLMAGNDSVKRQIANQEGAVAGLVECLAVKNQPDLQCISALALNNLAKSEEANTVLRRTEGLLKGLTSLLEADIPPNTQQVGAFALTLVDSTLGKEASPATAEACLGRAEALNYLKMHAEALADLDRAIELQNGTQPSALQRRCFTRTKIGDFDEALEDANQALKVSDSDGIPFCLQERGILKSITRDLEGALADLNEGLKLATDDYERLKHRGYVKFLVKDEEGARADAEWALRIRPSRVDCHAYERGDFLGAIPVEYLGYKLK